MQLLQLRIADLGRGVGKRVLGRLGFREGHHVANGLGAGHQHD